MQFTRIKETCLYVSDLKKTIAFYRDKLGLEMFIHSENEHAFFRAGESVLLCFNPDHTKTQTDIPRHYGSGELHIAFETEKEEYDNWQKKVREAHIEIEHEHTWPGGHRSFYFRDPDNHCLEIIEQGMWET